MALPATFDTIQVQGTYLSFVGGAPCSGTVKFSLPVGAWLKHLDTDTMLVPAQMSVTLDAEGKFTLQLPVTNDPDVVPNFTYRVEENITGPGQAMSRSYNVEIPLELLPGPIDLSDLAPTGVVVTGTTALTRAVADALYVPGDVEGATDGQSLVFDAGVGKWVPGAPTGGLIDADDITDATLVGRAVIRSADASAARSAIGAASTADGAAGVAAKAETDAATSSSTPSTIVRRNVAGEFTADAIGLVDQPTLTSHATRKDYVDALGTQAATPSTIMRRDGNGDVSVRMVVGSLAPTAAGHLARKDYVDTAAAPGVAAKAQTDAATSTNAASNLVRRDAAGGAGFGQVFVGGAVPTAANHLTRKDYVDTAISDAISTLINAAPGALDTLDELAAALGDDPSFATTVTNLIANVEGDVATLTSEVADKVGKAGNETITGTKTFSAPPVVPTATADGQAVNRGQVASMMGSFTRVVKSADESVANSITLQADDHLTIAVPASAVGRRCRVEVLMFVSGDAALDVRSMLTLPANSMAKGYVSGVTESAGVASGTVIRQPFLHTAGATVPGTGTAVTDGYTHNALPTNSGSPVTMVEWVVDFIPTAAGDASISWAQRVSGATATVVHAGSEISLLVEAS